MKNMFIICLCLLIIPRSGWCENKIVLVRSTSASDMELDQFVEVYPSHLTYVSFLDRMQMKAPDRKTLLDKFEAAQRDFLNNSIEKARSSYSAVAEMAHKFSWFKQDRIVIYNSLLRLAQLEPSRSAAWLTQAARFALELKPNEKLFPPPLVKSALQTRRETLNDIQLWSPDFHESASLIKIDGRAYRLGKNTSIPLTAGLHRVEIWSNSGPAHARIASREQILQLQYKPEPFVQGTCSQPEFRQRPSTDKSEVGIFYSVSCVQKRVQDEWISLNLPRKHFVPERAALVFPQVPEIKSKKSSKWVWWAALGAAAGAYLIYENNRQRNATRIEPTHETGLKE